MVVYVHFCGTPGNVQVTSRVAVAADPDRSTSLTLTAGVTGPMPRTRVWNDASTSALAAATNSTGLRSFLLKPGRQLGRRPFRVVAVGSGQPTGATGQQERHGQQPAERPPSTTDEARDRRSSPHLSFPEPNIPAILPSDYEPPPDHTGGVA